LPALPVRLLGIDGVRTNGDAKKRNETHNFSGAINQADDLG
jgi:hypothetical protein